MEEKRSLPQPRPIAPFVRGDRPPEEIIRDLLVRHKNEMDALRGELAAERKKRDAMAARFALAVYRKRTPQNAASLRAFTQALADMGIQEVTYLGERVTEDIETMADIAEWLPGDGGTEDRVAGAMEPELRLDGRLIHRARLSCMRAGIDATVAAKPDPDACHTTEKPDGARGAAATDKPKKPAQKLNRKGAKKHAAKKRSRRN